MTDKAEDYNPEAFPVAFNLNQAVVTGMTLRDYFAAKAMQSMLLNKYPNKYDLAAHAYKFADIMLKVRSQK